LAVKTNEPRHHIAAACQALKLESSDYSTLKTRRNFILGGGQIHQ
jgi:hypothetical protein